MRIDANPDGGERRYISARHVHLGIWALVLFHSWAARFGHVESHLRESFLQGANGIIAISFLSVFHLLTSHPDNEADNAYKNARAGAQDFKIFGAVAFTLTASSILGIKFDVPALLFLLGAYYFTSYCQIQDKKLIGFVYLALAFNGFLAPLIFIIFKNHFLIGEVHLASFLNGLIGVETVADGAHLRSESGMKLQMVGACSIFSNISMAVLGFISFRAFFRHTLNRHCLYFVVGLALCLILMNAFRIGVMTISRPHYEYWHNGFGVSIFAIAQIILILSMSILSMTMMKRS